MKIFEESWEVCNKVGGIYTVLNSKAQYLKEKYSENYVLIGPYQKNLIEFVEDNIPAELEGIYKNLLSRGIVLHYGYWDIKGKPKVFLIDFHDFFRREINYWKYKYWEWYQIDSLNSDYTYDEPFAWSVAVGIFLEELDKIYNFKKILHAHEWLSGGTILYVKAKNLNYKTIFTTHGTVIGRTISSRNLDIVKLIDKIEADKEAYSLKVHYKHQMEKNSAKYSDIFTTVSEILSMEAEKFLGRKPDKIIYNSISIEEKDIKKEYLTSRRWLEEFVLWYFMPYYEIDLKKTIFIYTIGRYEFYNKGIDLIIDLMKYLNHSNIDKNIILFLFIPTGISGVSKNVLRLYNNYQFLKEFFELEKIEIIKFLMRKDYEKIKYIFEEYLPKVSKSSKPSIVTHDLYDKSDLILNKLIESGLDNEEKDKVKVVYAPVYIGQDIIFNLPKEKILSGFDIGIFLSRYEPFGYTALENIYYGIPTIISDKTGFSLSLKNKGIESKNILLVDINNFNEEMEKIKDFIFYISNLEFEKYLEVKKEIFNISKFYDWKKEINNYIDIYEALNNLQ
ncbi:MAG: glycogen/starch synthase [Nanopusillaceae archaeon]